MSKYKTHKMTPRNKPVKFGISEARWNKLDIDEFNSDLQVDIFRLRAKQEWFRSVERRRVKEGVPNRVAGEYHKKHKKKWHRRRIKCTGN